MQLVIPMSGIGQRFIKAGYKTPKPLLEIENKPIIDVAEKHCDLSRDELIKLLNPLKLTKGGL